MRSGRSETTSHEPGDRRLAPALRPHEPAHSGVLAPAGLLRRLHTPPSQPAEHGGPVRDHGSSFPLFAQGKSLRDVTATLAIRTKDDIDPGAFSVEVDGGALGTWNPQSELGGLRSAPLLGAFTSSVRPATHAIRVTNAGALAGSASEGAVDIDTLLDVLLVVEYKL